MDNRPNTPTNLAVFDVTCTTVSLVWDLVEATFEERTVAYAIHYKDETNGESWWRHQMETFLASLTLCAGNSPVTGEFPSQRPVMRSFDIFSLICTWINGWVNNREAGDLRRHRADITVKYWINWDLCIYSLRRLTSQISRRFDLSRFRFAPSPP